MSERSQQKQERWNEIDDDGDGDEEIINKYGNIDENKTLFRSSLQSSLSISASKLLRFFVFFFNLVLLYIAWFARSAHSVYKA